MRVASSVIDSGGGQTVRLLFANVGSMLYIFDASDGLPIQSKSKNATRGQNGGRQ